MQAIHLTVALLGQTKKKTTKPRKDRGKNTCSCMPLTKAQQLAARDYDMIVIFCSNPKVTKLMMRKNASTMHAIAVYKVVHAKVTATRNI